MFSVGFVMPLYSTVKRNDKVPEHICVTTKLGINLSGLQMIKKEEFISHEISWMQKRSALWTNQIITLANKDQWNDCNSIETLF